MEVGILWITIINFCSEKKKNFVTRHRKLFKKIEKVKKEKKKKTNIKKKKKSFIYLFCYSVFWFLNFGNKKKKECFFFFG